MKGKRYRVKLKSGRIIGPFHKEDIGDLYLKGHLEGDEQYQYFPVGDWAAVKEFQELSDYIHEIIDEKPSDDSNKIKEFEYDKQTQIDINYDELEKKAASTKKDIEETRIIQKKPSVEIEKTIVKNIQQKNPKDEMEEKKEEKIPERKEEPVNIDAKTKVLNIRLDMADVRKEAEHFEQESAKDTGESNKKERLKGKYNLQKIKMTNKKKITPIVALSIIVVVYFVLFDSGEKEGVDPKSFNVKIPVAYQVENKSKAKKLLDMGKESYNKGNYLNKIKAAEHFYLSVSHQYRGNKALGHLIMTYAELYPNVLEKEKRRAAVRLHKIIQTAASRHLQDINVALGAALFYNHIGKYDTAIYMIENYLRVSPPSKKLFCIYLNVLLDAGKLSKGRKAFEQVKNIVDKGGNVPVAAYLSMSKYYLFNEELEKALGIIKKGIRKNPKSVPLFIGLAELTVKKLEALELSLKDPAFLKEFALLVKILKLIEEYKSDHAPAYYAKYLEFSGLLSAIQGDTQTAAKLFKISLAINDSRKLRSKLATLSLGGGNLAEKLILENKIIDRMKKSRASLKERKWKEAFSYALEAVEYNEDYIPAQLLLVEIQTKRGYYDDAINSLKELNKLHKGNRKIHFKLVDTYLDVNKFKSAYQNIIEMNRMAKIGQTAEFASLQGKYFLKKGDDFLASKWFQESISRNPLDERNYFELSKIYLRNRNYSKSKSVLARALALTPNKTEYHLVYASILYEYDSPEVAIGYLRKILETDKENKDILGQIAIFYYRNGQHKDFELYKKELERSVFRNTLFYSFLIRASILNGDYKETEKYSRLLLESEPGNIEIRMSLGKTLYEAGLYAKADEVFNGILIRLESYPKVYYYLAKISLERKKFNNALSFAEKEIEGNSDLYYGYYVKGEIYRRMGPKKWRLAIKSLEKAISIDTNSVETLIALGWIYLRQDFAEKARELYLRAKNRDENNPEVRKQLGFSYRAIGQDALAIDELKVYLQLKPDAPDRRDVEFLIRRLSR